MKKHHSLHCLLILLLLGLPFISSRAAESDIAVAGLKVNPKGSFLLDEIPFTFVTYDSSWAQTSLASFKLEPDFPKNTDNAWTSRSTLPLQGKTMTFDAKIERIDDQQFRLLYTVTVPEGLPDGVVCLEAELPLDETAGKDILVDGAPLPLPAKFGDSQLLVKKASTLVLPGLTGTITLEGIPYVLIQDERRWDKKAFKARVSLVRGSTSASLSATVRFTPYDSSPLSFAGQANMGFADPVAGDGKGGWSDQGPANDMSPLPTGPLKAAAVQFDILNPAKNDGKSALVFTGPTGTKFLSSADIPVTGQTSFSYLYFLHAQAWTPPGREVIGKVAVHYTDGTETDFDVTSSQDVGDWWAPTGLANGTVGWSGVNASNPVGLYVSCFHIEKKPIKEIHLEGTGKSIWMIAGISGSQDEIHFPTNVSTTTAPNNDWKPFSYTLDIQPGSVFDFSSLNDAPAGKYGALKASSTGHFEFEKRPGAPVRFWGINLCFTANFLDKAQADELAARLARSGYNTVRFHHFDGLLVKKGGSSSYDLDPEQLDKLEYLFSALKARGIYMNIDLYVDRKFTKEEIPDLGRNFGPEIKRLLPLSDKAFDSWEKFTQALLTHKNPYTGLTWAEDPALIGICPVNEDSTIQLPKDDPGVKALYEEAFEKWLVQQKPEIAAHKPSAAMRFLMEIFEKSDARMAASLKKLGVKALVSGTNYQNSEMLFYLREHYDYVDAHQYWDHPQFAEKKWSLPYKFTQTSATKQGARAPRALMPERIFGKPFTVTEFNYVWPNGYRSEGGLLIAAYASLQDWDALYNFNFASDKSKALDLLRNVTFDISSDPINLLADRFSAVAFRRGDIKSAPGAVGFVPQEEKIYASDRTTPLDFPGSFAELGLITRIGTVLSMQKTSDLKALVEDAPLSQDKGLSKLPVFAAGDDLIEKLAKDGIIPAASGQTDGKHYLSETGEIDLRGDEGVMKVTAPRTEAFVLPAGKQVDGAIATVTNGAAFGSLYILSADGKPLAQSDRILILHLTDCLNDKMQFADSARRMLTAMGNLPQLVRRGSVDLSLRLADAKDNPWKAWRVAPNGARQQPLPISSGNGLLQLHLETVSSDGVCLAYELARDKK